jgi:orotate phosphoribosyltransferase
VGEAGWEALGACLRDRGLEAACIGGMTMGADPISLVLAMASARDETSRTLQAFTVRKEPKGHGRGKRIEGNFKEGDTVVVVDDVITTGGSTIRAIEAIEAEGGKVALAFVLVDREEGGCEAIEALGVPVLPLFTRTSLLGE